MATIPKMLMDEFYAESRAALNENNYSRSTIFGSAESFVNNFLHGNTPAVCLTRTRNALRSFLKDGLDSEEVTAVNDALIIIDMYAEQYGLTLEA